MPKRAPESAPQIRAFLLCERVMEEKDGTLSVIRIIDNIAVAARPSVEQPQEMPTIQIPCYVLISFKAGDVRGERSFVVTLTSPSGKRTVGQDVEFAAFFENEDTSANIILHINFTTNEVGRYYIDLYPKGAERALARLPFQILYGVTTPQRTK